MSQSNLSKKDLLSEIVGLREETERLRQKISDLETEKADLELMIEMNADHSDHMEEELHSRVESTLRESEKRFRMITETMPVPIVISRVPGNDIVYANKLASEVLEVPVETLLKHRAVEYYDPDDRKALSDTLAAQGYVNNYEINGRTAGGTPFWVALFVRPLTFNDEPCLLTVWYDLTERKKAEEEIRRLNEQLQQREREREGKYLIFRLADEEYGVGILNVKEIIGMMPFTPVPRTPDFIKGMINLRGRVITVADLRLRFGLNAADYTDQTCIIVMEIMQEGESAQAFKVTFGVVVDSVSEVLNIKGRDIEDPPEFGLGVNADYILGLARVGEKVKILIHIDSIFRAGHIVGMKREE